MATPPTCAPIIMPRARAGKSGATPFVETTGALHRMSLISAITDARPYAVHDQRKGWACNAAVFIEILERLMVGAKRAIFLIVDRCPR